MLFQLDDDAMPHIGPKINKNVKTFNFLVISKNLGHWGQNNEEEDETK